MLSLSVACCACCTGCFFPVLQFQMCSARLQAQRQRQRCPVGAVAGTIGVVALLREAAGRKVRHVVHVVAGVGAPHVAAPVAAGSWGIGSGFRSGAVIRNECPVMTYRAHQKQGAFRCLWACGVVQTKGAPIVKMGAPPECESLDSPASTQAAFARTARLRFFCSNTKEQFGCRIGAQTLSPSAPSMEMETVPETPQ